jgi:hypothetical protein
VPARELDQACAFEQGDVERSRSGAWHAESNMHIVQTISVSNPDRFSERLY